MRAVVVRAHGDVSALRHETFPDPKVLAGQVGVAVRACGVNHLDIWLRRGVPGHTFQLPLIPGNDVAGEVAFLGAGVTDLQVGEPVVVAPGVSCGVCPRCLAGADHHCRRYGILGEHCHGGYAQYVAVPRANVMRRPEGISYEQAAALGIAHLTAWHMLVGRAHLLPGETVLVVAAGSGVGTAAIQIAKMWGAQVIATASTPQKLQRAAELGATHLINSQTQDVAQRVKAITAGAGADVVFEHVGAATWASSVRSLSWQGRLVVCGATTGGQVPLNLQHLFYKSQSILGSTMGSKGDFCQVLAHAARGALRPVIDRIVPLAQVAAAHTALEARQVFGKIILQP
jgi:NADPH:quinone reductase-like Zn-dependent oxidoreductase